MFNNSSSDDDTVVDYNEEIKIVFLGESGVGKSNIINRYNGGQFNPNSVPNNSSFFMSKNLKFGEKIYRINLWDTAGQEKYHSLTKIFLNEAKIAFIIYAINDKASYEKIDFWYNLVKESCGNIVIAIIGNKKDLYEEEQVNEEDAIKKAKSLNATFGLTSALEDDTGFDEIINKVLKKYIEDQGESTENQVFSSNIKLSLRDTIKSTKSEDSSKKKKKLC
jgi:small GTP-binding protein